jgi:hypothetical protein
MLSIGIARVQRAIPPYGIRLSVHHAAGRADRDRRVHVTAVDPTAEHARRAPGRCDHIVTICVYPDGAPVRRRRRSHSLGATAILTIASGWPVQRASHGQRIGSPSSTLSQVIARPSERERRAPCLSRSTHHGRSPFTCFAREGRPALRRVRPHGTRARCSAAEVQVATKLTQ